MWERALLSKRKKVYKEGIIATDGIAATAPFNMIFLLDLLTAMLLDIWAWETSGFSNMATSNTFYKVWDSISSIPDKKKCETLLVWRYPLV